MTASIGERVGAASPAQAPPAGVQRRLMPERSRSVAVWLFAIGALVVAMVILGGATRLTGSGLSITAWKPLRGVVPPLSAADWAAEFRNYQRIPQYYVLNHDMTLEGFKPLFWWEWAHRLLGRVMGLAFFVPLIAFVALRRLPRRLVVPCVVIFLLGGLQGAIGWWMVSSGVFSRDLTAVAPERLAVHLGLALVLMCACLWTGLDAWFGPSVGPRSEDRRWAGRAGALLGLVFFQALLGALVAGNKAGLIYNDWPLMAGRLLPEDYVRGGPWTTLLHSQAAVQFNHRLVAYALFAAAVAFAVDVGRSRAASPAVRGLAAALAAGVTLQALLGIATLMALAPLGLSITHQLGAVAVLSVAVALAWRTRRANVV